MPSSYSIWQKTERIREGLVCLIQKVDSVVDSKQKKEFFFIGEKGSGLDNWFDPFI